jgi:hypothetical protein
MDRLSPEIICMIFDYLVYNGSARRRRHGLRNFRICSTLAVVSRKWQHIIEKELFRHIRLRCTINEISQFGSIYSQPRLQAILQWLSLRAVYQCECVGVSHDFCEYQHNAIMGALSALLQAVDGWKTTSPSLGSAQPGLLLDIATDLRESDEHLQDSSPFKQDCPRVGWSTEAANYITSLSVGWSMNYLTTYRLPALFSNLQTLEINLLPVSHELEAHQSLFRVRKALIRALRDARTSLPYLRSLAISMGVDEPRNNQFRCPDLRDEDGIDELCEAIRLLSLAVPLRELRLYRVQVSLDLFQDCRLTDMETDSTPWPLLEHVQVSFPPLASSGIWYTEGDPETYTGPPGPQPFTDVELATSRDNTFHPRIDLQYRNTIDPVTFNPLQAAFARAVLRMLALRFGTLSMVIVSGDSLGVGMMDRSIRYHIGKHYHGSPAWTEQIKKAKEADAVLNQKERVVRVEGAIEDRAVFESMSRSKPLNRKTMFRNRPLWVPTPEITDLWMGWTMGI